MTINFPSMFQALQSSRDYELQAILEIMSAKSGGSSNPGGINPADDSENGPSNGVDGAGSVNSSNTATDTMTNNTVQAYGIMAEIAMLTEQDITNKNTSNETEINSLLGQLKNLQSSLDPTCAQNVQSVLAMFTNPSSFSAAEANFQTFWNNPNTVPNSGPVSGTVYNPMSDAFYFLQSNNVQIGALDSDAGFGLMMLLLSIDGNKTEALGLEGLLDNYLSQNGAENITSFIEQFIFGYAIMMGMDPTALVAMLPAPLSSTDAYGLFYAQLKADAPNYQKNHPGMPQPNDPNYAQELQNWIDGAWMNLSSFSI